MDEINEVNVNKEEEVETITPTEETDIAVVENEETGSSGLKKAGIAGLIAAGVFAGYKFGKWAVPKIKNKFNELKAKKAQKEQETDSQNEIDEEFVEVSDEEDN